MSAGQTHQFYLLRSFAFVEQRIALPGGCRTETHTPLKPALVMPPGCARLLWRCSSGWPELQLLPALQQKAPQFMQGFSGGVSD